jgi:hypothetical protein
MQGASLFTAASGGGSIVVMLRSNALHVFRLPAAVFFCVPIVHIEAPVRPAVAL